MYFDNIVNNRRLNYYNYLDNLLNDDNNKYRKYARKYLSNKSNTNIINPSISVYANRTRYEEPNTIESSILYYIKNKNWERIYYIMSFLHIRTFIDKNGTLSNVGLGFEIVPKSIINDIYISVN